MVHLLLGHQKILGHRIHELKQAVEERHTLNPALNDRSLNKTKAAVLKSGKSEFEFSLLHLFTLLLSLDDMKFSVSQLHL